MDRRRFVTSALGSSVAQGLGLPAAAQNTSAPAPRGPRVSGRKRVLFWAVDAMDPAMVARFLDRMPNVQRIIREGYSGRILPYVSCWINMDFMSMMTGAPPGTQYRSRTASGGPPGHDS